MPHDAPLQVAEPFEGTGHGEHELPHDAVDELLTQVPLQLCVPPGHAHWPPWQVIPPLHANCEPQPPQFELSLLKSTQPPLHEL
jgi:hypothetical protein